MVGVDRSKVRSVLLLEWWRSTRRCWEGADGDVVGLGRGAPKFSRSGTLRSDELPLNSKVVVEKMGWAGRGDSNLFGIGAPSSTSGSDGPTAVISGDCSGK